jgi:hypothetical protein
VPKYQKFETSNVWLGSMAYSLTRFYSQPIDLKINFPWFHSPNKRSPGLFTSLNIVCLQERLHKSMTVFQTDGLTRLIKCTLYILCVEWSKCRRSCGLAASHACTARIGQVTHSRINWSGEVEAAAGAGIVSHHTVPRPTPTRHPIQTTPNLARNF